MVKTRFAPSPTGFLHIGGARTALFSWLYARKNKGEFILRIEDTDKMRSRKEFLEEILESLAWLEINWDKIYYQSERFDIYKEFAYKLIREGKAYEKEEAIFFKYEFEKIKIHDLIRGEIIFNELPKEEEVIIKRDGTPTYNFSCVIDDALMGITHVIRGEDHLSNTPKQILMYKALNFNIPEFAHVPLILSEQGGRMSKRWGATSIREYREAGYLPEAVVNYLVLLGWSPGKNREIIPISEVKKIFNIKDINKTAAAFSWDKLNWINSQYIKKKPLEELKEIAKNYLKERNFLPEGVSDAYLGKVVELFRSRISRLSDLTDWAYFCFYDDFKYSPDTEEILAHHLSEEIKMLIERLTKVDDFNKENIEKALRETASQLGLKARDLVHPTRVALTGKKVGPGLFETMEVLGKDKVINRLKRLINYWEQNK